MLHHPAVLNPHPLEYPHSKPGDACFRTRAYPEEKRRTRDEKIGGEKMGAVDAFDGMGLHGPLPQRLQRKQWRERQGA